MGQGGRADRLQRVRRHRPRSSTSGPAATSTRRTSAREIDELNEWIYSEFQNGVYRAGFARSQEAYDEAFRGVFAALDRLEALLRERRYLAGDAITIADWRLLPTLLRFDAVYHTHFRCNGARLIEYPNLLALHEATSTTQPHVAETFALEEIKRHYYTTHDELNPKRIIPPGRSTWLH